MGVVPSALKNFEQNEIANQKRFPAVASSSLAVAEVQARECAQSRRSYLQESRPARRAVLTHFLEIALPSQSLEAASAFDLSA